MNVLFASSTLHNWYVARAGKHENNVITDLILVESVHLFSKLCYQLLSGSEVRLHLCRLEHNGILKVLYLSEEGLHFLFHTRVNALL